MNQTILNEKKELVKEIQEKIEKAQSIILVDYRGLNVEEATELRSKCREAGVEYKIYKNSMMRFAFENAGYKNFNSNLKGPNAIAISYDDAISAAKVASEYSKGNEKFEIKAGIVDGKIIDLEGVKELASIPSREVLIAKMLGSLNSPIAGFANVLQANIRNLANVLDQIKEQKKA